ncbi:uncharacterized protein LOC106137702 [Amyelois transitella]|uniref:uncharacterized protein LOC106137702 n=1 Tax=Amyelois transitella TaxID=680683 RepID=UPI00067D79B2|nr:uncharacterized protein LOC106137702 [Amyelois transitella]XP_013194051.1 uncharacterized protein LOC106137702 [Amyelois transitella]XP_060801971.1 uncharacterized protein LOC106137702 [Amyelois transitella]XP_060801972.1 uncharacterized protein LOC106137702 [Amyelois transitella]XP_060801973.1 uncharacterized protein LOC106137702 [Amyelois transitella]
MVFSQTSHETRGLLKVVEIDRLKPEKSQQVNNTTGGEITDDNPGMMPSSPLHTSFSEEYLKPEPLFENTMFPEPDYEFFQDLDWSSAQGRDAPARTTDMPINKTEERANTFDTTNTQFSPTGWEATSPLAYTSFYGTTTPHDSLSPTAVDGFSKFDEFLYAQEFTKPNPTEQIFNITDLPVVIDEGTEGCGVENIWPVTNNLAWPYTNTPQYTKHTNTTHNMPFIPLEDSLNQDDLKFMPVMPREVENSKLVLSDYPSDHRFKGEDIQEIGVRTHPMGLSVDVAAARRSQGPNISTPDVVNCVVQMERQETPPHLDEKHSSGWPPEFGFETHDDYVKPTVLSPVETRPPTPVEESQTESDTDYLPPRRTTKRRHPSDDSDETYTPTRKEKERKRKKPDIKIKAIMDALEKTKARRGRPPNRRMSIVSSTGSVDDNASNLSNQEMKYRELRDKNNEASKRSRMNRKLKELQMEQLADELEEQNKKLKVRANILEEMTVKLKNALMAAMTQK